MEGIPFSQFEEWTKGYDWLEVLSKTEDDVCIHYYLAPSGSMITVSEGDGEVISVEVSK